MTVVNDSDLQTLDPASRALLDMSVHRGMSNEEIAELMDTSPDAVRAWVDDALFNLTAESNGTATETTPPRREHRLPQSAAVVLTLIPLLLMAALVFARDSWAAGIVLLPLLLIYPGHLLLRALRVRTDAIRAFPVYVPCASIVVLLAAGLAVDLVGPPLGAAEPLRAMPMLIGIEAVCILLAVAGIGAGPDVGVQLRPAAFRLRRLWPAMLPALAAAGALRLTNGHSASVAIVAAVATVVTLVFLLARAGRLSRGQLSFGLYCVALAAIWAFSLRSRFVYGWDISSEFHVLANTLNAGVWHSSHPHDAYGAMMSLTILPAALSALTGISGLVLLKAVFPLLFALFPVGLFWVALRFVSRRWAIVAAAFVLVQSYYFQELPAIARQEIALLLFVGFVAALLDKRLPAGPRFALLALLGAGVAVSHYSTTYLAIGMVAVALVTQAVLFILRRPVPGMAVPLVVGLVALMAGAGVWYGAVTHSTSNAEDFTTNIREHGLDLLPSAKPGQGFVQSYLSGNTPKKVDARRYERLVTRDYRKHRNFIIPIPAAKHSKYDLRDASVSGATVRAPKVKEGLGTLQVLIAQIANALAVLGAAVLILRRRAGPVARAVGLLAFGTLGALVMIRLSGTAAQAYNQQRAFVQTMVPLAIALVWLLQAVTSRWRPLRIVTPALAAVALAVIFVSTTGVSALAVGGDKPTSLANSGEDFERFYITRPELAAAEFVGGVKPGDLVYTDRYGQLGLLAATGRTQGLLLDPTPRSLDQHAWIYGSRTNVGPGRARGQVGNDYTTYQWPKQFLADEFNTVYTNGTSSVYHR